MGQQAGGFLALLKDGTLSATSECAKCLLSTISTEYNYVRDRHEKFPEGFEDIIQISCAYGAKEYEFDNNTKVIAILYKNGNLYTRGTSSLGVLGQGNTTSITAFRLVASNVALVNTSRAALVYVTNDGNLYGCGIARAFGMGQNSVTPVKTPTLLLSNVKYADCTDEFVVAVMRDGTVMGIGEDNYGGLGLGTDHAYYSKFVQISGLSNIRYVICASDSETFALDNNGEGWYMGNNYAYVESGFPGKFAYVDTEVVAITPSSAWCVQVLDSSGQLLFAGTNGFGQKGDGTPPYDLDIRFSKTLSGISKILAGGNSTFVVKQDGGLYGAGNSGLGWSFSDHEVSYSTFTYLGVLDNDVALYANDIYIPNISDPPPIEDLFCHQVSI